MAGKSGVAAAEGESFYDMDAEMVQVSDLSRTVETSEREKNELVKNNEEEEEEEEEKLGVGKIDMEKKRMIEWFMLEYGEIRRAKAVVETKVGELESKIKGTEEGAKAELTLKMSEISLLKRKMAQLEAAGINSSMLELISKEKVEKKELENALSVSDVKVSELERKLIILQNKVEEAERANRGLKKTAMRAVHSDEGSNKLTINLQWALGTGATILFVGGIICLHYARRR